MGTARDGIPRVGVSARGRLIAWTAFVAVFAALNYASRFSGGSAPEDPLYRYGTAVAGLVQYAIVLGIVLWIARGAPKRDVFALRRPDSWASALTLAVGIFFAVLALAAGLSPFLDPGEEQGLVPDRWQPNRAPAFAVNAVVVVIVAPVVEELTFRGLGLTLLLTRLARWVAIVVVGIAFAAAHGLLEALPILAALGSALAFLRTKTASLYPAILLHASFNGFALLGALLVDN